MHLIFFNRGISTFPDYNLNLNPYNSIVRTNSFSSNFYKDQRSHFHTSSNSNGSKKIANNNQLNPSYITGLADGDSHFGFTVYKSNNHKIG